MQIEHFSVPLYGLGMIELDKEVIIAGGATHVSEIHASVLHIKDFQSITACTDLTPMNYARRYFNLVVMPLYIPRPILRCRTRLVNLRP